MKSTLKNVIICTIVIVFGVVIFASASSPSKQTTQNPPPVQQAEPQPKVETKTETQTEIIAYETEEQNDNTLLKGETKVVQEGKNGVKTKTFTVTYTDGQKTSSILTKEEITTQPVNKIIAIGTKIITTPAPKPKPVDPPKTSSCDPNYSGACVPIASDVDCAGGSGNGPAYVAGPVTVIGTDIYRLDSDHNGISCER